MNKDRKLPRGPRARSREYDPKTDPMIARWAAQVHLEQKDIARRIGVPVMHLRQWLHDHPELAQAIAAGQRTADAQVIEALFKLANGYDYEQPEITTNERLPKSGAKAKVKRTRLHYPADMKAITFWLKNRKPEDWSEMLKPNVRTEIIVRMRRIPQLPPAPAALPGKDDPPPQA